MTRGSPSRHVEKRSKMNQDRAATPYTKATLPRADAAVLNMLLLVLLGRARILCRWLILHPRIGLLTPLVVM